MFLYVFCGVHLCVVHELQLRSDDPNETDLLTPTDRLSPPSTTSRLSDSDTTSECDIDGITTGRDGASISSFGSSSSPPLPQEVKEFFKKPTTKFDEH